MKEIDTNRVARIEKAISKKYGHDAVINPKSLWDDQKEEEYLEQLKKLSKKERKRKEETVKIEKDGFFLPKNLINKKSERTCSGCNEYSFSKQDDVYMNKFECCFKCYVRWIEPGGTKQRGDMPVEDRKERWLRGWRPNNEKKE